MKIRKHLRKTKIWLLKINYNKRGIFVIVMVAIKLVRKGRM